MRPESELSAPVFDAGPPTCPNCEAVAQSHFCPECGQRQGPVTTRGLAHELVDELFNLDGKFPRTVRQLLRPGFLTAEYFAGRRDRYVRPFRLFLVFSFLLFLLFGLMPIRPPAAASKQGGDPLVALLSNFQGVLGDHLKRFSAGGPMAEAARLKATFTEAAPKSNVLALPVFALLLAALFRKSKRTFADHFVFGLHYHAFYFLVGVVTSLLMFVGPAAGSPWVGLGVSAATILTVWMYLGLALKRAYSEGWGWTILKEFGLIVVYSVVQYVISFAILILAVMRA